MFVTLIVFSLFCTRCLEFTLLLFSPTVLSSRFLPKNLKIKIYETIILPAVLYGFETLREGGRLRVFENRTLRRIIGPIRGENGKWRTLHTEELHSLYRSPNIVRITKSRSLRWTGHVTRMEEDRSPFTILKGKPTGKRSLMGGQY